MARQKAMYVESKHVEKIIKAEDDGTDKFVDYSIGSSRLKICYQLLSQRITDPPNLSKPVRERCKRTHNTAAIKESTTAASRLAAIEKP